MYLAAVLVVSAGCTLERKLSAANQAGSLDHESPFLKAHMRDGDVYVLHDWQVDEPAGVVRGNGDHYDMNRDLVGKGPQVVSLTQVSLFETNRETLHAPSVTALSILTVASASVTALCLMNPKACFGSCPTFYVQDGVSDGRVAAEAFSASVAPALEARDVDALFRARPSSRTLRLRVTNEALETHVIRHAEIMAVRRPRGGRVVATSDGHLWQVNALRAPATCRASEGDCRAAVSATDELERASLSDPDDLSTRETVELTFPSQAGAADASPPRRALVLEARQTFITTFLFYQALAYMGTKAGTYLAALERGDPALRARATRLHHLLGDIEVQVPDGRGGWTSVGAFDETGPIARDVQVIPLPAGARGERVRLRMTRGHWRLGAVALADLGGEATPVRLRPARLDTVAGDAAAAGDWLAGRRPSLVTVPGDEHVLTFELPENPEELELFLDTRGYYIEWMRQSWLAEESAWRVGLLLEQPALALRTLAPAYKKLEPQIEDLFWRSRYVRPTAR